MFGKRRTERERAGERGPAQLTNLQREIERERKREHESERETET